MITFRDVVRRERVAEKLAALETHLVGGDAEAALLEAGELEQGVLDVCRPARDDRGEVERMLRRFIHATAAAYLARRERDAASEHLATARSALDRLRRAELPAWIEVRAPEGFAHYALDPAGYAHAATQYAREVGPEHAARAVVVGVRSIGTTLSAIVAAAIGAERSLAVRPRGTSGTRRVAATPALSSALLEWRGAAGDVLIVDEGPGATGETFRCVARWLIEVGIPAARIVLFPSHLQPPAFGDPAVGAFFTAARRYAPPFDGGRVERVCARFDLSQPVELSGGRWREVVAGAADAVAFPRHERLKYLASDRDGHAHLIRYAGLGREGAASAARAERLAATGVGARVVGCEAGFLVTEWTVGDRLSPACVASREFGRALAAYLAARTPLFRTGAAVGVVPVAAMLRENATEALGTAPAGLAAALARLDRLTEREAAIADARLQTREWVRLPNGGFRKLDAIDHGDGVRLPGPADPAWDVAGAAVEFRLDDAAVDELVERCARAAGESAAALARAVAAYRAPYAACQLGEVALSAREGLAETDRARLLREADRYTHLLRCELARAEVAHG